MTEDAGAWMKARLRADLVAALKGGRKSETALLRGLIAAIDNAEAVPLSTDQGSVMPRAFQDGSAEVERALLGAAQVRDILIREIAARDQAAAEFARLGDAERAAVLRAEAAAARRYLDP